MDLLLAVVQSDPNALLVFILWCVAVALVIYGVIRILRGDVIGGVVLIILGLLVGPGGVSLFT